MAKGQSALGDGNLRLSRQIHVLKNDRKQKIGMT